MKVSSVTFNECASWSSRNAKCKGADFESAVINDDAQPPVNSSPTVDARKDRQKFIWLLIVILAFLITAGIITGVLVGNKEDGDLDTSTIISGQIVDIHNRKIFSGTVTIKDGNIVKIREDNDHTKNRTTQQYVLPGFVDSHVHIESSLLVPSEFARLAVLHGTVATVSDPHEIANVIGKDGVTYMVENGELVPFYFFFGAPSCVPATSYETAGAELDVENIKELFLDDRIKFLSEMMNFPGVLEDDPMVLEKIQAAVNSNRPVDGHAPGLRGDDAKHYISHGITTDHECFELAEAQDKLSFGMKIQIREGHAARNYEELHPIIGTHPENTMFCTDDAHPDLLLMGHIDYHVRRSIENGYDIFDVLRIASINPIDHYKLPVGLLREGDSADFIIVDSLKSDFQVLETWIKGIKVADRGTSLIDRRENIPIVNNFNRKKHVTFADISTNHHSDEDDVRVIVAQDGSLITKEEILKATDDDVLKLVVINRYEDNALPAIAYVKGFGIQTGAIASSVAHDSHNIVATGVNDEDITNAINGIIDVSGGLAVSTGNFTAVLPLPVGGLMSNKDAYAVAEDYTWIEYMAKMHGSPFRAPFTTLSFMALLVIPELKLSDLGLFDGRTFSFVDVVA